MSGASPTDDVASDLIDAYLIAVENSLVAANAPRADRMQVLENLETQIAEMLAPYPLPFTDEAVRAVLDKLEPPSHFAATYASGREATASPSTPTRFAQRPRLEWPMVAAVSAAILVLGCLFGLLTINGGPNDLLISVTLLSWLVGFLLTPIALWKAYQQLRTQPGAPGRSLVLKSTIVYAVLAPILLMLFAIEISNGGAIIPLGLAGFFYCQYTLTRRLWRRLSEMLPPQSASSPRSNRDTNGNGASSPVTSATPMPAV